MSEETVSLDGIEWTSIEDEDTLIAKLNDVVVEARFYGPFWMAHAKKMLSGNDFMSEVVVTKRFADKSGLREAALDCVGRIERAATAMRAAGLLYED